MKHHSTGRGKALLLATALSLLATAPTAIAGPGGKGQQQRPSVERIEFKDARMKIEMNATDGDAGVHVYIDAEAWRWVSIYDPRGRLVFYSSVRGRLGRQGGTELFLESAEPDFSELTLEQFKRRFPEGTYRFRGRGKDGERFFSRVNFDHNIPDGPELVYPLEDSAPVDADNVELMWEGVAAVNGSPITGYNVIVEEEDPDVTGIPSVTFSVIVSPDLRTLRVPPGFLKPGTEYKWEVVAIEAGGNQTLSEETFFTRD